MDLSVYEALSEVNVVFRVLRLLRRIRTGSKLPFLTAYFHRACLGHLEKEWIVRGTTTRRLPYCCALLPKLEQVVQTYSLSVAV